MALVSLKQILDEALQAGYAVGSFNVVSLDSLQGILEAATQLRSPVILSLAEVHFKYVDLDAIVPVIRQAAERAPVPVALHLDHGLSLEAAMRCFRLGFTSLMFDGSALPYEENVARTAEIVRVAHSVGVTVEAELGRVGGGGEGGAEPAEADQAYFTDPEQAADFVRRTGVDALAVAVGSVHGLYKGKPRLDFPRLSAISRGTGIPLVLHGGSGIPDEDIRRAISLGIAKINVYTEMSMQATERIRQKVADPKVISFPDLLLLARQGIRETVTEKVRVFGSANICTVPNTFCPSCGACVLADNTPEGTRSCTCNSASGGSSNSEQLNHGAATAAEPKGEGASQLSDTELARLIALVTRQILAMQG